MFTTTNKFFLIIAVMVLPIWVLAQSSTKEQLKVTLSKPGKAFKLNLTLDKGNIKVIAYDGNSLEIEAVPLINKLEKATSDQKPNTNTNINTNTNTNVNVHTTSTVAAKNAGGKYITVKETNNTVNITPMSSAKALSVVIKVPKNGGSFNIAILSQGDISFLNVAGDVEVNTSNGSIMLINISGSAVANAVSGNISGTFKSVNTASPMAFSTLVGKIDISFPANIKTYLKIKTDSGELFTDFDITADKTKPDATPQPKPNPNATISGQPKFKLNNSGWVYGKINQGGPEIMMKNMQGNIYIRKGN